MRDVRAKRERGDGRGTASPGRRRDAGVPARASKPWLGWLLSLALAVHLWSTVHSWAGLMSGERVLHVLIALLYGLGVLAAFLYRRP